MFAKLIVHSYKLNIMLIVQRATLYFLVITRYQSVDGSIEFMDKRCKLLQCNRDNDNAMQTYIVK